MKIKLYVILIILFITCSCNDKVEPLFDEESVVVGRVVDAQSHLPIDSVMIVYKNPTADSLIFMGDTISSNVPNPVLDIAKSNIDGHFMFRFFLWPEPPPYEIMLAYKSGYSLWTFESGRDSIFHLSSYLDSININLVHE